MASSCNIASARRRRKIANGIRVGMLHPSPRVDSSGEDLLSWPMKRRSLEPGCG
jgi:hypothetical protein